MITRLSSAIGAGILLPLIVCAMVGCKPSPRPGDRPDPAVLSQPTFEKILGDNNAAIASGEALVKGPIESALVPLELVNLYTERARLTGNYDDYGRAEDLLARFPAKFKAMDGLCLARAKLNFTLHRLSPVKG